MNKISYLPEARPNKFCSVMQTVINSKKLLCLLLTAFAVNLLGLIPTVAQTNIRYINGMYSGLPRVSFEVWWNASPTRDVTDGNGKCYNSRVWVLIDYCEVDAAGNPVGEWQRATIGGMIMATPPGIAEREPGNNSGFWLRGINGAFTTTVTVSLMGVPDRFKFCAYANDHPPVAKININNAGFAGTPPFVVTYSDFTTGTFINKTINTVTKRIVSLTDKTGCPSTDIQCTITAPALSGAATVCSGGSVTLTTTTTLGCTYALLLNGVATGQTLSGTGSPQSFAAVTAAGTYSVLATNIAGGCTATSGVQAVANYPAFTPGSISGSQTITTGSIAAAIPGTAASGGQTPYTYRWYINGGSAFTNTTPNYTPTPGTATATYEYTRQAKDACATTYTESTGAYTLTVQPTAVPCGSVFDFGVVSFTAGTEITISGNGITQIWSRPVTATGCQKATYNGGADPDYTIDCRTNPSYAGDLFSWCAVNNYQTTLCPSPWRVPSVDDFINLDKAMGGTGVNRNSANTFAYYISVSGETYNWAGAYAGACYNSGTLDYQGSRTHYWSATESNSNHGYHLGVGTTYSHVFPQYSNNKYYGFTLRCVK